MATVNVTTSATSLTTNDQYGVIDLTFSYAGTTAQHGTTIYYAVSLSDGTVSESALFPLTVTSGSNIPASEEFAYTPGVAFTSAVTPTNGKVYYTV